MKTQLAHMQLNVQQANLPFYRDLMLFLGWSIIYETDDMLGVGDANNTSCWFVGYVKEVANDYDGPGLNHLGIGATSQADVDATAVFLQEHGVPALFETPRHRPEFSHNPEQTYYQVMFETPDRILLEVVYTGPKA
jgi:catechol 2,3-dioxygenase-like lactoylglutathione lyase family enzyme